MAGGHVMKLAAIWKIFALFVISTFPACAAYRTYHQVSFIDPPCIIPHKGFEYRTCQNINVKIDDNDVTIPLGFQTDLASIPRIFWNILPPQQADFVGPAILHDWMYATGYQTRAYDDDVLYWSLRQQGAMWITANIIWLGVRFGGASHFSEKKDVNT